MKAPLFITRTLTMTGSRGNALATARGRLTFMRFAFALAFVLVAVRVTDLTLLQGRGDADMSGDHTNRVSLTSSVRSDIVDRNGVLLATTLVTPSLAVNPRLIKDPDRVAADLAKIFPDISPDFIRGQMARDTRFAWIKRNMTPAEMEAVLRVGDPGLIFENEARRIYPQGPLAAHIVGFTDVDGRGSAGIERSFNKVLQSGRAPVKLSLDIRVQHIVRREIAQAMKDFSARGAAGIVMDISTGETIAAVSLPDFDPHAPTSLGEEALFNRVTLGSYELGSVFKIFSTAALFEMNRQALSMIFDARHPLERGRFTISDFHPEKRIMTLPEVFMHSSNIGTALMAETVGTARMKSFYSDLGLLDRMDIEIAESAPPRIPKPWRDINTITASYGHGIAVTPLQMTAAAASIVGDGTFVHPTFLIRDEKSAKDRRSVRVASLETAHRMRQLLRLVVADEEGTGTKADVPGYNVGGKTGTAEQPGVGGYDRKRLISSFIGFFPMQEPRYAIYVMVEEPKPNKDSFGYATAGWVAAPAAGRVILNMAAVLGISPSSPGNADELTAPLMPYIQGRLTDMEGKRLASN